MQRYLSDVEETIRIIRNLQLNNLELGLNKPIFIDSFGNGRGVALKLIDDHPWTELTRLEDTPLTICRLLQQRKIAKKVMKKNLFYGVSLYAKYLCREVLLRSIQALKSLLK